MHNNTRLTVWTALVCAFSVLGAGCAGAADKDQKAAQDEAIRWEAPQAAAADASGATMTPMPAGGYGYSGYASGDDIRSLWEEMDRMHQSMFNSFGGWNRPSRSTIFPSGITEMHSDVVETDKEYVITCELPGVPKDRIQIDVDGSTLLVRAVRDAGTDRSGVENGQKFHYRERSYGTTERRFRIGSGVDPKKIKASLKDGVLTLRVPKGESRSHQIPIEG